MDVVVVAVSRPLAPFGVVVDGCPLGGSTFGAVRDQTLRACGLRPPTEKTASSASITGPCLVVSDELWVTRRALKAFLKASSSSAATVRLALPASRMLELTLALQDVDVDAAGGAVFPCAFVPAGVSTTVDDALRAPGLVIAYKELPIVMPVPRWLLGRPAATTTWPLTSTVALRVRHWLHVLRASHLAPQVWLIERALGDPLRSAARALLGLRPSSTARFMAWKRQFVFRGRNCVIHPSAIVEASVIGDDVIIGPQAVVLQSVIGDGVVIEQRAHVAQSTLGPRTFVSLNSSMQACVTFADADACANNLQACVVGARTGLTSFARALDSVVGGEVRVDDDGALRSVGELPCGVAFGPGSYVGANVTIAAGRTIPAGVRVVGAPAGVLRRVGAEAPGTFVVDDGALRSVTSD
ncbi:MAG: hypothetical protein Q8O67_14430 [Deltaproteobacteria bacterium]|nr:hypothetical protein [Deltaproteobacteria bacterium]